MKRIVSAVAAVLVTAFSLFAFADTSKPAKPEVTTVIGLIVDENLVGFVIIDSKGGHVDISKGDCAKDVACVSTVETAIKEHKLDTIRIQRQADDAEKGTAPSDQLYSYKT